MDSVEADDFLLHPMRSIFERPETQREAVSQLEGLTQEGLPGYFPFPISSRRLFLFHRQVTDVSADGLSMAICDFYEMIRSPDELFIALNLENSLSDRGVPFGYRPQLLVAVTIFPSMFDAPNGIVPMPEDDEHSVGDHIVISLGYKERRLFFLNNWGPEWGVQAIGSYSSEYVQRYWREASSNRWITGPAPDLASEMEKGLGPSPERWHELLVGTWDEEGSTQFFPLHYGTAVDVFGRWIIGVADGSMWLQCIAVMHEAEARPIIIGWMHIRGTAEGADIEEFFVWPPYRERGIGTTLAGQALLYAAMTSWQHGRWRWCELEADVIMRERSRWNPRIPSWLKVLLSNPDSAMADRKQLLSLLKRLADLQSPDGVRLLHRSVADESKDLDIVVNDESPSAPGVIVKIQNKT